MCKEMNCSEQVSIKEDKEELEHFKAFMVPFEAYYSSAVKSVSKYPYLMIGFYCKYGGCEGEFQIEWNNIGIQLHAFDDSWKILNEMPELLKLMADLDSLNPTIEEFVIKLKEIGYKDITERVNTEVERNIIVASIGDVSKTTDYFG